MVDFPTPGLPVRINNGATIVCLRAKLPHMNHTIRTYDPARDLDAVARIWLEVGWMKDAAKAPVLGAFLESANAEVAEMKGEAECMVHWTPGSIAYENESLSLCAITAVTTSHIGRKLGFASAMTTRALEQGVADGCAVAALGMFEQGFYDRFGFGTAAYDNEFVFDPAALMVDHVPYEPPVRLTTDDSADMQQALLGRLTAHGAVSLHQPGITVSDVKFRASPFGLGYRNESGELTHFFSGPMKSSQGPWHIRGLAYQSTDQLLQLLRLLRELADQIRSVKLVEPPHVQLQALLKDPIRERARSGGSTHASDSRSFAWWQLRILDLEVCVAARRWHGPELRFNLTLVDPLEDRLDASWRGIGGEYTVTVGQTSKLDQGHTAGLDTLAAGVGAFTRLWFGVRAATTLVVTDDLDGPAQLLGALDQALLLPRPLPGWDF
jgi:predicted acetyltransferase